MAKKALIAKAARKPKFGVRGYTRCQRCGRPHSVYRKFGLCRVCLREMAHRGELPGVTKRLLVIPLLGIPGLSVSNGRVRRPPLHGLGLEGWAPDGRPYDLLRRRSTAPHPPRLGSRRGMGTWKPRRERPKANS